MKIVSVIPFHKKEMSEDEYASLVRYAEILGARETFFVVPEDLDCSRYLQILPSASIHFFPRKFFTSVSGYNHLLLTPEFYSVFSDYDYMLIYQLDAWIFRDELDFWCEKGFDYIGAPFDLPQGKMHSVIVGNGGLSLRKISAMLRVLGSPEKNMFPPILLRRFIRAYFSSGQYVHCLVPLLKLFHLLPNTRGRFLEHIRKEKFNSEDMVFHYLSGSFTPDGLSMPDIAEAALFSLDTEPEKHWRKLPFGCHAWRKNDWLFWQKYITPAQQKKVDL